jgi:hypothetical protein
MKSCCMNVDKDHRCGRIAGDYCVFVCMDGMIREGQLALLLLKEGKRLFLLYSWRR